MAAKRGLENRATFVGSIPDLAPYYAAADAYVHPTYYDPCSLVLLEAAASGLPIVTTRRHNGATELFRDERDLLSVNEPGESEALLERLEAILEPGLRERLGAAARQVALRNSFARNVERIMGLYHRPIDRRAAA